MPLFFDTNVPVGYIFKWDPWHTFATNAFNNGDLKYWSETVENETNDKLNDHTRDYLNFLNAIRYKLKISDGFFKKDDLIPLVNSSEIDLDSRKRRIVIESIWATEGFNYEEHSQKILDSLNNITMDFNKDVYSRKNDFSSKVQLHKRTKQYSKIKRELKEKIHYPDFEIFLDAHDLCLIHSDLEFITSDYKTENIEYVKSKTLIRTIKDLREYVF